MTTVNIYLNFNGNAEEAFNHYKSTFGGEFSMLQRFKDAPSDVPLPEADGNKILHVALPISKETMLMASDIPPHYPNAVFGTNCSISVNVDSEAEADRIFKSLSEEGNITMPLEKTFWGAYFGMCADKFGIQWMVSCELKK